MLIFHPSMVQGGMLAMSHQHKVFWSIVRRIVVKMVDYFAKFKITTQHGFHDQSLFTDITTIILERMCGAFNKDISTFIYHSSTLPIPMLPKFSRSLLSPFLRVNKSFTLMPTLVSFSPSYRNLRRVKGSVGNNLSASASTWFRNLFYFHTLIIPQVNQTI